MRDGRAFGGRWLVVEMVGGGGGGWWVVGGTWLVPDRSGTDTRE